MFDRVINRLLQLEIQSAHYSEFEQVFRQLYYLLKK